jgi:uncharacterized membrane protein YphA (DoxX/SURF4 family)
VALDKQGTGLTIVRIAIGVFFIFEGLGKWRWFGTSAILATQLGHWADGVAAGSVSDWYLHHVAMPGTAVFARLVPLGEMACGAAMAAGFWTRTAALVAFLMALNFHVASGALFRYGFLTNGYGLPVLGATLGLALGGVRLPWSLRG